MAVVTTWKVGLESIDCPSRGTSPELLGSLENPLPAPAAHRMDNSGGLRTSSTFHHPSAACSHPGRQVRVWGGAPDMGVLPISWIRKLRPRPERPVTCPGTPPGTLPLPALRCPTWYSLCQVTWKSEASRGRSFTVRGPGNGNRAWETKIKKAFLGDEVRGACASAQVRRLETPLAFQRDPSPPCH